MNSLSLQSLFFLFLAAAVAQDEAAAGVRSTSFDQKYYLPEKLLINPQTHPGLFSFTGRWLLSPARPTRPQPQVYQSTLWPGNSVTVLVHGANVSVQLVPKSQGWIEDYHFYASVDGGPDVRYDIPPFNSSELTEAGEAAWFDIDIDGLGADTAGLLQPHTLRLTSVPATPLCLEGVNVERTLISQGREWIQDQDRRVVLEFIGAGTDPDGFFAPSDGWLRSVQYRVGETLGVRHLHTTAEPCLLPCTPDTPGLAAQYFQTSPLPLTPRAPPESPLDPHHPSHLTTPYRFPVTSANPPVRAAPAPPVHRDIPAAAPADLRDFLVRLRTVAHPTAFILVVPRTRAHAVAVAALRDPRTVLLPLPSAENEHAAFVRALCPFLAPRGKRAESACSAAQTPAGGAAWKAVLAAVGVLAAWASRATLVGAAAAVCGRRRLRMEEVEVEVGGGGRDKSG